jgi:hypothetical protein
MKRVLVIITLLAVAAPTSAQTYHLTPDGDGGFYMEKVTPQSVHAKEKKRSEMLESVPEEDILGEALKRRGAQTTAPTLPQQ